MDEMNLDNIKFHKITMADKELFTQLMTDEYLEVCDYIFANNMLWSQAYDTEIAVVEECLLIKYLISGETMFAYPVNPSKQHRMQCVRRLLDYHVKTGKRLKFTLLTGRFREELQNAFPGIFEITSFRDGFDYVYKREALELLPGRKLAAKRNHIRRFSDKGEWSYEKIGPSNAEECLQLERDWLGKQPKEEISQLGKEYQALQFAFSHYGQLGLSGGAIRQNGRIVAFSVGEQLNRDTYVVHFEKADMDVQGSYQMINQQMAAHQKKYLYFNREDDTGDAGLRKSKLSYHPECLVKKYMAETSDFTFASKEDFEDIIHLWQISFSDSPGYIRFFLENMFAEETILCRRRSGKVVSMACMFPARVCNDKMSENVIYLYATATLPECQKQGLATSIVTHIYEKYQKPVLICPENPSAELFYERMGFQKEFESRNRSSMRRGENELKQQGKDKETKLQDSTGKDHPGKNVFGSCSDETGTEGMQLAEIATSGMREWKGLRPEETASRLQKPEESCQQKTTSKLKKLEELRPEENFDELTQAYLSSRQRRFLWNTYVEWDANYLSYALKEHIYCGGRIAKGYDGYVLFKVLSDHILLVENTVSENYEAEVLSELSALGGGKPVKYEEKAGLWLTKTKAESRPFGDGYIALTLG